MDRTYEDVAQRAYELFLARGGQHGRDMDDWLAAEQQLTANSTPTDQHFADGSAKKATAARKRAVGGRRSSRSIV